MPCARGGVNADPTLMRLATKFGTITHLLQGKIFWIVDPSDGVGLEESTCRDSSAIVECMRSKEGPFNITIRPIIFQRQS